MYKINLASLEAIKEAGHLYLSMETRRVVWFPGEGRDFHDEYLELGRYDPNEGCWIPADWICRKRNLVKNPSFFAVDFHRLLMESSGMEFEIGPALNFHAAQLWAGSKEMRLPNLEEAAYIVRGTTLPVVNGHFWCFAADGSLYAANPRDGYLFPVLIDTMAITVAVRDPLPKAEGEYEKCRKLYLKAAGFLSSEKADEDVILYWGEKMREAANRLVVVRKISPTTK